MRGQARWPDGGRLRFVPTLRVGGTQTWSAGPITGGLSLGAVVFP